MPKQKTLNCPMKFNGRTLEADGFVKKETCLCDEEACAWWRPELSMCAINNLIEVMNKLELMSGMQLKALLAEGQTNTKIVDVER
ncbi:MAG: hypothetical protein JXA01_06100 [Dehalococcoidia bacterium]|nr:hypothetical protein [Dehalococcoidia bacterium]